jgi:hypothetical protein
MRQGADLIALSRQPRNVITEWYAGNLFWENSVTRSSRDNYYNMFIQKWKLRTFCQRETFNSKWLIWKQCEGLEISGYV